MNAEWFVDKNVISDVIRSDIADAQVTVIGEGCNLTIEVVSQQFEGLNRVKRQQKIYACLSEFIQSGELHAISMKTMTPSEVGG